MSINSFVILVCVVALILGIFIGVIGFKIHNYRTNKKLLKNAKEVMEGKRPNKIKIDGEEYDATKFILRDKEDNEILIDLKGGDEIKNGKTKENQDREGENIDEQDKDNIASGEDSSGPREKKRTFRRINPRRIRRFG